MVYGKRKCSRRLILSCLFAAGLALGIGMNPVQAKGSKAAALILDEEVPQKETANTPVDTTKGIDGAEAYGEKVINLHGNSVIITEKYIYIDSNKDGVLDENEKPGAFEITDTYTSIYGVYNEQASDPIVITYQSGTLPVYGVAGGAADNLTINCTGGSPKVICGVIGGTADNVVIDCKNASPQKIYGVRSCNAMVGNVAITTKDVEGTELCGECDSSKVTGNVNITMTDSSFQAVYGVARGSVITGDVTITTNGGVSVGDNNSDANPINGLYGIYGGVTFKGNVMLNLQGKSEKQDVMPIIYGVHGSQSEGGTLTISADAVSLGKVYGAFGSPKGSDKDTTVTLDLKNGTADKVCAVEEYDIVSSTADRAVCVTMTDFVAQNMEAVKESIIHAQGKTAIDIDVTGKSAIAKEFYGVINTSTDTDASVEGGVDICFGQEGVEAEKTGTVYGAYGNANITGDFVMTGKNANVDNIHLCANARIKGNMTYETDAATVVGSLICMQGSSVTGDVKIDCYGGASTLMKLSGISGSYSGEEYAVGGSFAVNILGGKFSSGSNGILDTNVKVKKDASISVTDAEIAGNSSYMINGGIVGGNINVTSNDGRLTAETVLVNNAKVTGNVTIDMQKTEGVDGSGFIPLRESNVNGSVKITLAECTIKGFHGMTGMKNNDITLKLNGGSYELASAESFYRGTSSQPATIDIQATGADITFRQSDTPSLNITSSENQSVLARFDETCTLPADFAVAPETSSGSTILAQVAKDYYVSGPYVLTEELLKDVEDIQFFAYNQELPVSVSAKDVYIENSRITVPAGVTLTASGNVTLGEGGSLTNSGSIAVQNATDALNKLTLHKGTVLKNMEEGSLTLGCGVKNEGTIYNLGTMTQTYTGDGCTSLGNVYTVQNVKLGKPTEEYSVAGTAIYYPVETSYPAEFVSDVAVETVSSGVEGDHVKYVQAGSAMNIVVKGVRVEEVENVVYGSGKVKAVSSGDNKWTGTMPFEKTQIVVSLHQYGDWVKNDLETHKRVCANEGCDQEILEKHIWGKGVVKKPATATQTGIRTYVCVECKTEKEEEIDKLEAEHTHTYGDWTGRDAETHKKTCSCGDVIIADHDWGKGVVKEPATLEAEGVRLYTCAACGQTKEESIPVLTSTHTHVYGDWERKDAGTHKKTCSCGEEITESHDWGKGVVTKAATTETTGIRKFTCAVCAATKQETIDKLETVHTHVYGDWTKNNADTHKKECSCGEMITNPHDWGKGVVTKLPTTSAEGIRTYTCTLCGEIKDEAIEKLITEEHTHMYGDWTKKDGEMHQKMCSCGETIAETHKWGKGVVVVAATDKKAGVRTYTCSVCGQTKDEEIPKLETTHTHVYGDWTRSDADSHKKVCSCGNVITQAHSFGKGVVTIAATTEKAGVKTYTCTVCGETKDEAIPKLEAAHTHAYGDWIRNDDKTHKKLCNCGEVLTQAHSFGKGVVAVAATDQKAGVRTYTCSMCGQTKDEVIPKLEATHTHVYGDWIENDSKTHKKLCSCGKEIEQAHSFGKGVVTIKATTEKEGLRTYTCSACGQTKDEVIPKLTETHTHTYGEWIPDNDRNHKKMCICGKVVTQAHSFGKGVVTVAATTKDPGVRTYTCSLCGETKDEAIPKLEATHTHVYGDWSKNDNETHKKICSCGKEITQAHSFGKGVVTQAATVEQPGVRTYTCTACGETKDEEIPKLKAGHTHAYGDWIRNDADTHRKVCDCGEEITESHTFGKGVVTEEATPEKTGVKTFTCKVCGETKDEEIPKLEATHTTHEYGEWIRKDDKTHKQICDCGVEKTEAHKWDEGAVTVEATTTEPGVKTYTCTECGETRDEEIPKLEATHTHAYGEWIKNDDKSHKKLCECGDIQTEPHKWDEGKITREATAEESGVMTYTCTVCGEVKTSEIDKKGPVPEEYGKNLTDTKTKAVYKVNSKDGEEPAVIYTKCTNKKASSVTIPATVQINNISYKVTEIAKNAFKNNKKITKVSIGKNVTKIGANAFSGCIKLKTVTIEKNVSRIESKAFYNCKALTKLTIKTTKLTAKTVGSKAFSKAGSKNYKKLTVKVPSKKLKAYKTLLKKKGLHKKAKVKK